MKAEEEIIGKTREKVGEYLRQKYISISISTLVNEEVGEIIRLYKEAEKEIKKTPKLKLHKKGNHNFYNRRHLSLVKRQK